MAEGSGKVVNSCNSISTNNINYGNIKSKEDLESHISKLASCCDSFSPKSSSMQSVQLSSDNLKKLEALRKFNNDYNKGKFNTIPKSKSLSASTSNNLIKIRETVENYNSGNNAFSPVNDKSNSSYQDYKDHYRQKVKNRPFYQEKIIDKGDYINQLIMGELLDNSPNFTNEKDFKKSKFFITYNKIMGQDSDKNKFEYGEFVSLKNAKKESSQNSEQEVSSCYSNDKNDKNVSIDDFKPKPGLDDIALSSEKQTSNATSSSPLNNKETNGTESKTDENESPNSKNSDGFFDLDDESDNNNTKTQVAGANGNSVAKNEKLFELPKMAGNDNQDYINVSLQAIFKLPDLSKLLDPEANKLHGSEQSKIQTALKEIYTIANKKPNIFNKNKRNIRLEQLQKELFDNVKKYADNAHLDNKKIDLTDPNEFLYIVFKALDYGQEKKEPENNSPDYDDPFERIQIINHESGGSLTAMFEKQEITYKDTPPKTFFVQIDRELDEGIIEIDFEDLSLTSDGNKAKYKPKLVICQEGQGTNYGRCAAYTEFDSTVASNQGWSNEDKKNEIKTNSTMILYELEQVSENSNN
ncbi:MAG: hypothetical protein GY874_15895 [Desulfobacteraceae bacterium]|nr:hypothetical protein [Desulfobacteraceae bacterium]